MKIILLGIMWIVTVPVLTSCEGYRISSVFDDQAPIAVLLEENSWSNGADVPLVALYDNGLLVYKDESIVNDFPFKAIYLQKNELNKLLKQIGPIEKFFQLHPYFSLVDGWDLPSTKIFLSNSEHRKFVSIYGSHIVNKQLVIIFNEDKNIVAPKEFIRIQSILSGLSYPSATPWIPEYYKIIICAPSETSRPDTFPDLKIQLTERRKNDEYSLLIKGTRKAELIKFFPYRQKREDIVIGGKKWAVVSILPVFPGEPIWQAAEKEIENIKPKNNGI